MINLPPSAGPKRQTLSFSFIIWRLSMMDCFILFLWSNTRSKELNGIARLQEGNCMCSSLQVYSHLEHSLVYGAPQISVFPLAIVIVFALVIVIVFVIVNVIVIAMEHLDCWLQEKKRASLIKS